LNAALTPGLLRSLLSFNAETGLFIWKSRPVEMFTDERAARVWNTRYANREAFTCINKDGYRVGAIFYANVYAHRIAFLMVEGRRIPDGLEIDHINGVRSDNRWINLRAVPRIINTRNRSRSNSRIYPGIIERNGRFRASISVKGKPQYLGTFPTAQQAIAARQKAESELGFVTRN